ncbi:MAG: hypothetical protein Q8T08_19160 [Ignavibacteria bacterium]|nr:hypothetical protein [Ignavibacteria bacterium]
MKQNKRLSTIYIIGVVALIVGAIDPLEGSVVIVAGGLLLAIATYLRRDRYWKFFATTFILMLIGTVFMFYLSSLGGFGGTSDLSWWWGILILPYPIGWLGAIIILIVRAAKKKAKL